VLRYRLELVAAMPIVERTGLRTLREKALRRTSVLLGKDVGPLSGGT
jgi:hypothetical protein